MDYSTFLHNDTATQYLPRSLSPMYTTRIYTGRKYGPYIRVVCIRLCVAVTDVTDQASLAFSTDLPVSSILTLGTSSLWTIRNFIDVELMFQLTSYLPLFSIFLVAPSCYLASIRGFLCEVDVLPVILVGIKELLALEFLPNFWAKGGFQRVNVCIWGEFRG